METVNTILETIKVLGSILALIVPLGVVVVQYLKEKLNVADKAAEIVSLFVGFVMSGLSAAAFIMDVGFPLTFAQYVGVILFLVIGTIGPSGGYKFLGSLTGSRL